MSTGMHAWLPNIRKEKVYPVEACTLVMHAIHAFFTCFSQSKGLSLAQVASMANKVLLNLSTKLYRYAGNMGWFSFSLSTKALIFLSLTGIQIVYHDWSVTALEKSTVETLHQ